MHLYYNFIFSKDQYRLVYLALRDAFSGRSKCLKTEKFLSYYQEHSCYTNCGDVEQKKLYSSDLEVETPEHRNLDLHLDFVVVVVIVFITNSFVTLLFNIKLINKHNILQFLIYICRSYCL